MDEFMRFSDVELAGKSYAELQALLADERLLMSDGDASNDLIFRITAAMHAKENKTERQLEAERIRFWAGMVARYGDKIPVNLENVIQNRETRLASSGGGSAGRMYRRRFLSRNTLKRLVAVAALAAVVLVGNSLAAYAFNINFLRIAVDFTDSLFVKTIMPAEGVRPGDTDGSDGLDGSGAFAAFHNAFDAFGISRPRFPEQLPGGFGLDFFQVNERPDYAKISAQYKNGDKIVTAIVFSYSAVPEARTRHLEKSAGSPTVYARSGIEFYLFDNMERMVATWTDGYVDCEIQGNVSDEEMKAIIDSIYTED
jgi:hypothetical protein